MFYDRGAGINRLMADAVVWHATQDSFDGYVGGTTVVVSFSKIFLLSVEKREDEMNEILVGKSGKRDREDLLSR